MWWTTLLIHDCLRALISQEKAVKYFSAGWPKAEKVAFPTNLCFLKGAQLEIVQNRIRLFLETVLWPGCDNGQTATTTKDGRRFRTKTMTGYEEIGPEHFDVVCKIQRDLTDGPGPVCGTSGCDRVICFLAISRSATRPSLDRPHLVLKLFGLAWQPPIQVR
jgi:hypothetical protein